jgi:hypothetical protein
VHISLSGLPYSVSLVDTMPILNDLECHIKPFESSIPFKELDTRFRGRSATTLVQALGTITRFCITIKSTKYISSGLGVFIYIDGVYQCNRLKLELKIPCAGEAFDVDKSGINFVLSQAESHLYDESLPNGGAAFRVRPWQFGPLHSSKSSVISMLD